MDEQIEFADGLFVNILQTWIEAAEGEEDEPSILAVAPLDLEVGHVDGGPKHTKGGVVSVVGLVGYASSLIGLFDLAVSAHLEDLLNSNHQSVND